jgi:hypothetical protein
MTFGELMAAIPTDLGLGSYRIARPAKFRQPFLHPTPDD